MKNITLALLATTAIAGLSNAAFAENTNTFKPTGMAYVNAQQSRGDLNLLDGTIRAFRSSFTFRQYGNENKTFLNGLAYRSGVTSNARGNNNTIDNNVFLSYSAITDTILGNKNTLTNAILSYVPTVSLRQTIAKIAVGDGNTLTATIGGNTDSSIIQQVAKYKILDDKSELWDQITKNNGNTITSTQGNTINSTTFVRITGNNDAFHTTSTEQSNTSSSSIVVNVIGDYNASDIVQRDSINKHSKLTQTGSHNIFNDTLEGNNSHVTTDQKGDRNSGGVYNYSSSFPKYVFDHNDVTLTQDGNDNLSTAFLWDAKNVTAKTEQVGNFNDTRIIASGDTINFTGNIFGDYNTVNRMNSYNNTNSSIFFDKDWRIVNDDKYVEGGGSTGTGQGGANSTVIINQGTKTNKTKGNNILFSESGQTGGNRLEINQGQTAGAVNNTIRSIQQGNNNSLIIDQASSYGTTNSSVIGDGNKFGISQKGISAKMDILIKGNGNETLDPYGKQGKIIQHNSREYNLNAGMNISITGDKNKILLNKDYYQYHQYGEENEMKIDVAGNSNIITPSQIGYNNKMTLTVNHSGNEMTSLQHGGNNTMNLTLTGDDNKMRGLQIGSRNTMNLTLTGDNNKLAGEQYGDGNNLTVNFTGDRNILTYSQQVDLVPLTVTSNASDQNIRLIQTIYGQTTGTHAATGETAWK